MPKSDWEKFYAITKDRPPSSLLVRAINLVKNRSHALDLGAGALKDTKFLLAQGFNKITVVDSEPLAELLGKEFSSDQIKFVHSKFEDFSFPKNKYDIINAQYALPFNPPSTFDSMFSKLANSLKTGGIFTGQFFGVNDEWNGQRPEMTFYSIDEVKSLLSTMEILELEEENRDSRLADGTPKHWHAFHVIVKK